MTNSMETRTGAVAMAPRAPADAPPRPPTIRPSAALRTVTSRGATPSATSTTVPSYDLNAAYAAFVAQVPDAANVLNNDVTNTDYALGYHNDNWVIWQQCVLATAH
jgi:hypothetical protein